MTARWLIVPAACAAIVALATVLVPPAAAPSAAPMSALPASDPAGCAPCHARRRPVWHDDDVTHPGRDRDARRAHADVGRARGGCGACHDRSFTRACGGCHAADERWRQEAP